MPVKKNKKTQKKKKSSKQNNSLGVIVILIVAAFIVTTCARRIAGDKEVVPSAKTSHKKHHRKSAAVRPLLREDFETGSKTSYNAGDAELASGSWKFKDAVTGSLADDHKTGSQCLRIKNSGAATMNFDIVAKGTVTVTLKYALHGNDESGSWELWASTNRGQRYYKTGNTITVDQHQLRSAVFTVAATGSIRFSIRKTDDSNSRLCFDVFTVTAGGKQPSATVTRPDEATRPGDKGSAGDDDNMLLGNPSNATAKVVMANNYMMDKGYYRLSYNRDRGTPNWVCWHVSRMDLGSISRGNDFRPDEDLPADWLQVTKSNYNGSGFDRGHNCPSGDRTHSREANEATFLMTNIIPQAPNHNQHLWANLENYTRSLVNNGNEVYVIMGSYGSGGDGSKGHAGKIGGSVTVPAHIWKVMVVIPDGNNDLQRITRDTRIIAVNTPNDNDVNTKWSAYLTTIDEIEKATGYRLLSNVPEKVRQELVKKIDIGGE